MAKNLDIEVNAEGVETEAQRGFLEQRDLKSDDCQRLLSSNFAFSRQLFITLIAYFEKVTFRLTSVQINNNLPQLFYLYQK